MGSADRIVFDPADHDAMSCQFMLSQLVVPRPIAVVSTRSPEGIPNIAPMSYYLPITGEPMLVGVTMGLREDGGQKHTYENASASGDFVINVCSDRFRDDIERIAMVGETAWQHWMATFCKPFTTAKVRYFDRTETPTAREWLQAV